MGGDVSRTVSTQVLNLGSTSPHRIQGRPVSAAVNPATNCVEVFYETSHRSSEVSIVPHFGQVPDGFRFLATAITSPFVVDQTHLSVSGTPITSVRGVVPFVYHIYWRQCSDSPR